MEWLIKLAAVFDADWYEIAGHARGGGQPGLSEDAAPFAPPPGHPLEHAHFGPNRDLWDVRTAALDAIGLNVGDQMLVDISQEAVDTVATGDAVVVQVIDAANPLKAVTLLRQYVEPDLFVANSRSLNPPPLNRALQDVRVKGKIVQRFAAMRPRF